jgi:hypothetical protein
VHYYTDTFRSLDDRSIGYDSARPLGNVVEAAPRCVSAHGGAHHVELVTEMQRVGELLEVCGVAL